MRLSVEESLQLETELHHEMSQERRQSRAQDATLIQFAQALQEKQPVIWEGTRESDQDDDEDDEDEADEEKEKACNKKRTKQPSGSTTKSCKC